MATRLYRRQIYELILALLSRHKTPDVHDSAKAALLDCDRSLLSLILVKKRIELARLEALDGKNAAQATAEYRERGIEKLRQAKQAHERQEAITGEAQEHSSTGGTDASARRVEGLTPKEGQVAGPSEQERFMDSIHGQIGRRRVEAELEDWASMRKERADMTNAERPFYLGAYDVDELLRWGERPYLEAQEEIQIKEEILSMTLRWEDGMQKEIERDIVEYAAKNAEGSLSISKDDIVRDILEVAAEVRKSQEECRYDEHDEDDYHSESDS